jgi:predicted Zn-dependent peptidase
VRSIPQEGPGIRGALRFLAALALSAAAALAQAPEGFVSETLPNGLRVSILPDPDMPVVATQVWYHVGSANEEPKTRGFAHLFEHLMFGGTADRPGRAVWDLHERYGGDVNAYTSFDETVYVSEIPPAGSREVLAIEADRMVHLDLNETNLDNEKRIVTEELRLSTENDPLSRLFTTALAGILGKHPYALTPVGTKEDIAAASLDHAADFYRRYYRPRNAHVVVVGPVDAEATLEAVREEFGALPADGETPADAPPVAGWPMPGRLALREDIPPVEIAVLGYPLPPPSDPDYPALLVLERILSPGAVDVFRDEMVRVRRHALEAGTEIEWARRGGILALYAANLPYRREKTAFRHMREVVERMGAFPWLDEDTLAAAKRRLGTSLLAHRYSAASTAGSIGRAEWWLGDGRLAFDDLARVDAVTVEDVRRVFRAYLLDARPVRVYVKPERVPLYVTLFGWLYPLFGGR